MKQENKYQGKFVIAYDTMVQRNQTVIDENEEPVLYDNYDEAFKELFDDAHTALAELTEEELAEMYEDVTKAHIERMGVVLESGNVELMKIFLDANPECNIRNEYVQSAEEFVND